VAQAEGAYRKHPGQCRQLRSVHPLGAIGMAELMSYR